MELYQLAQKIEHTALKVDIGKKKVEELCAEAISNNFKAVCIPPYFLPEAKHAISDSGIVLCTVVGFPFGYEPTTAKVEAVKWAALQGADEIDVVVNIPSILGDDWNFVQNDIASMVNAAHLNGKKIKVIIESAYLDKTKIQKMCEILIEVQPDFVKTSTGFAPEGATVEVVELLRQNLPESIKIKASGGIKSKTKTLALIKAGADRIGTSSAIEILDSLK